MDGALVEVTTGCKENKNLISLGAVLAPGHLVKNVERTFERFLTPEQFF